MKTRLILILSIFISSLTCYGQLNGNLLKVKGNATLYQIPEIMLVNIPLQVTDSLYENCSEKLTKIHHDLKKKLVANGIKKKSIKSDRLSVSEKTSWSKQGRIPDGYMGSINVKIEMKHTFKNLNSIINTLKEGSFNFGYNVNFKLSEEQKSKLLENAIELAISDAKNKAAIIAKNFDVKLVEIKEVNFGYSQPSYDMLTRESDAVFFMLEEEEESDEALTLNINPKKIQINKTINVIWKIEK